VSGNNIYSYSHVENNACKWFSSLLLLMKRGEERKVHVSRHIVMNLKEPSFFQLIGRYFKIQIHIFMKQSVS
jgi:hypothetical protein